MVVARVLQPTTIRLHSLQPVQLVVGGGGGVEQLRVLEAFADLLEDRDRLVEEHREADPRQVFADRILSRAYYST